MTDDFLSDLLVAPLHGTTSVKPTTGAITYTPELGFVGFDTFTYRVSDTLGASARGHVYVVVNAAALRLQADLLGGTMLVVDGTPGADTILVTPSTRAGEVVVSVNGSVTGPFRPTSRIELQGYEGDDRIQVSDQVRIPAWFVGGAGNDTLIAGGGPSILLGGDGADNLVSPERGATC